LLAPGNFIPRKLHAVGDVVEKQVR
jgi:hypothetical protein